jgi:hypothetical protein
MGGRKNTKKHSKPRRKCFHKSYKVPYLYRIYDKRDVYLPLPLPYIQPPILNRSGHHTPHPTSRNFLSAIAKSPLYIWVPQQARRLSSTQPPISSTETPIQSSRGYLPPTMNHDLLPSSPRQLSREPPSTSSWPTTSPPTMTSNSYSNATQMRPTFAKSPSRESGAKKAQKCT